MRDPHPGTKPGSLDSQMNTRVVNKTRIVASAKLQIIQKLMVIFLLCKSVVSYTWCESEMGCCATLWINEFALRIYENELTNLRNEEIVNKRISNLRYEFSKRICVMKRLLITEFAMRIWEGVNEFACGTNLRLFVNKRISNLRYEFVKRICVMRRLLINEFALRICETS